MEELLRGRVGGTRRVVETARESGPRKPVLADEPSELADASALHGWPQIEPKTETCGDSEHDEKRDENAPTVLHELSNGTVHEARPPGSSALTHLGS
jgi:hypothetical protein